MFVGVCVSSRRVSLVWGHGRNGCLSNVILNDAIRFDSVLTTAFATDIAEVIMRDSGKGRVGILLNGEAGQ